MAVMHPLFLVILSAFLVLFALINYYIGLRGWQAFGDWGNLNPAVYWTMFTAVAATYPVGRITEGKLPRAVSDTLIVTGSYWLGIMYYAFLALLLVDLIRFINHIANFVPPGIADSPSTVGMIGILAIATFVLYGIWSAHHPVIRHHTIVIPKPSGRLAQCKFAVVSDIHLGKIVGNTRLSQMVARLNSLKPDIILFIGDTIDEDIDYFAEAKMPDILRKLSAPYGCYAVLGNHEFIGRNWHGAVQHLHAAGITVLRDQSVMVAGSFYLVGRDDRSRPTFEHKPRKSLQELLIGIDHSFPLILLDHQPYELDAYANARFDLFIGGHTHRGQLFPNNYITQSIFEIDWGYMLKDTMHVIVSCGYGTWGPPLRTSSRPEIVVLDVRMRGDGV